MCKINNTTTLLVDVGLLVNTITVYRPNLHLMQHNKIGWLGIAISHLKELPATNEYCH